MDGWVDQFIILFDAKDQISDNTDFSMTKKLIVDAYKLILGQPKYLIGYNMGMIAKLFMKVALPIMPEPIRNTVVMFGEEGEELLNKLREYMSD